MAAAAPASATRFTVTPIMSDGSVSAPNTDGNLINPWGITQGGATGPFWISNNGSGTSSVLKGGGAHLLPDVTVNPGPSSPTGIVFNGGGGFNVTNGTKSGSSVFIYDTEGGIISGWSPGVDLGQTFLGKDESTLGPGGAVYKGLAIGSDAGSNVIYATDFRNGAVEEFDSGFNMIRSFSDPSVAAGYAPFGAQVLNGKLYVTYALQDSFKHDDVGGPGHGYVDIFNLDGTFDKQLVTLGGKLNSPWGLTIAPTGFGTFTGDLLVGNFGDGTISAFDPTTGAFKGSLLGIDGKPLALGDLWGLINGNGGMGGDLGKVYFTTGIVEESEGLFGSIAAVPEPGTWMLMIAGAGLAGAMLRRRRAASATREALSV
jgi:uncharacterized protein (TIGR03118 family)